MDEGNVLRWPGSRKDNWGSGQKFKGKLDTVTFIPPATFDYAGTNVEKAKT